MLPLYYEELIRVKSRVPIKERKNAAIEYSESCPCTTLLLAIANECEVAKKALQEHVLDSDGKIRIQGDGSYACSQELTMSSLFSIKKLFQKRIAKLVAGDVKSASRVGVFLQQLHESRGRTVSKIGDDLKCRAYEIDRVKKSELELETKFATLRDQEKTIHSNLILCMMDLQLLI